MRFIWIHLDCFLADAPKYPVNRLSLIQSVKFQIQLEKSLLLFNFESIWGTAELIFRWKDASAIEFVKQYIHLYRSTRLVTNYYIRQQRFPFEMNSYGVYYFFVIH